MFHESFNDAQRVKSIFKQNTCLVCSEELTGPTVAYHASETGVFMHPDCAASMAQVIISDLWPNRYNSGRKDGQKKIVASMNKVLTILGNKS